MAAAEAPGLVRVTLAAPRSGPVSWAVSFRPAPKTVPAPVTNLQAVQADAFAPVILSWEGNLPFYDISRDGSVVAVIVVVQENSHR